MSLMGIPQTGQQPIDAKEEAEAVTGAERFDRRRRFIGACGCLLLLVLG